MARYPFVVLLVPWVVLILSSYYMHWPWTLDTTVALPQMGSDTSRAYYPVVLHTPAQVRATTYRYEATILTGEQDLPNVLLYIHYDSTMQMPCMGDTLLVYTAWQEPSSLGRFNYAAYLRRQGVSGTGYVGKRDWQMMGASHMPWWRSPDGWQRRLQARYRELGITDRELGTISALTLGYREDLEPDIRRQFASAGAMHVLAVSGLHTSILMGVLMSLLTLFGRYKPLHKETARRIAIGATTILMLVAYAWLTGATPSVVRAVVMSSMVILAMLCHRENNMLNAIFASAFFILMVRPMDLFAVSFQLSFAAVIAIALFAPGWKRILPDNYVLGIIGMTVAAMIGTMPVTLHYYGQISNYFFLTNLIVLPLAWVMMVGGLFTLTIGWIAPIGRALAWIVNGATWLMNESVGWIEHLPGATTMVCVPLWGTFLIVGINIVILVLWDRWTTPPMTWR